MCGSGALLSFLRVPIFLNKRLISSFPAAGRQGDSATKISIDPSHTRTPCLAAAGPTEPEALTYRERRAPKNPKNNQKIIIREEAVIHAAACSLIDVNI